MMSHNCREKVLVMINSIPNTGSLYSNYFVHWHSFSGFMLSFPSFCTILLLYFVVAPKNCWKQLASKGIGDI